MNKEASGTDAAANSADTDKLYENREPKMIIRLLTVGAYMFSVSFAALVLSGYYIFLWQPPNSRLIHAHAAHLRADNEMDFMAADSLTVIRVDKSNRSELTDKFQGNDVNNRYTHVSNFNEDASQNRIFAQEDEELRRQNEQERGANKSVNKPDTNRMGANEETTHSGSVSINDKKLTKYTTEVSTKNVKINERSNKLDNSLPLEKLNQGKSKISNKFNYLNSEDVKIFKNFLRTL